MSEDFSFLRNVQDEPEEELPEWLDEATLAPPLEEDVDDPSIEDEFERLRQRAAMAANDLDDEMDGGPAGAGGGFLSQLSPGQRLVLAILLLLNVVIIAVAVLIVTGTVVF